MVWGYICLFVQGKDSGGSQRFPGEVILCSCVLLFGEMAPCICPHFSFLSCFSWGCIPTKSLPCWLLLPFRCWGEESLPHPSSSIAQMVNSFLPSQFPSSLLVF